MLTGLSNMLKSDVDRDDSEPQIEEDTARDFDRDTKIDPPHNQGALFSQATGANGPKEDFSKHEGWTDPEEAHLENVVQVTAIPAEQDSRRSQKPTIGDLYDEIEPEYKRLTTGSLDFDELDMNGLLTEWQSLKQADTLRLDPADATRKLGELSISEPARTEYADDGLKTIPENTASTVSAGTKPSEPAHNATEEIVQPDVLVTSARSTANASRNQSQDDDNRPDAAKLEDLKRFAYAHGSKGSKASKKQAVSGQPRGQDASSAHKSAQQASEPSTEVHQNSSLVPPAEDNLSFSRTSKVSKILGLKRDPHAASSSQQPSNSTRTSDEHDLAEEVEDSDLESDEESFQTASSKIVTDKPGGAVRRQVSFRTTASTSQVTLATEQTAKRALLIKAAHLEVCNHLIRTSRAREGIPQAENWSLVGLTGLSFWDRLTDLEKLKSQFTIIEIMRRYTFETQFSDALIDQILMRDSSSTLHETAVSLDPKTDLPLSTDIDNEVGRSKAAAEYIIEKLSAKLGSGTFQDHEDNVFKVPLKGGSPLSRIQSDSEWRLVQDAVSAHALGRGYQVQMGDGPEDITRPWQVRQKEDLKDALLSFTKFPTASEQIWIKVNRLGVEH